MPLKKTYYPKRAEVAKIVKHRPDAVMTDDAGRLYGFAFDSPILEDLKESGTVNQSTDALWWVHLPRRALDPTRDPKEHPLESDEVMDFPEVGETVEFFAFNDPTRTPVGTFSLVYFPENMTKKTRSAHIVVSLS